jgi:thiosulfate/3-mercaptopyruvate sulfurtransferase
MSMFNTLVSVADLQAHLFDHDWCVVDCRHDLADFTAGWTAYQAGHIPGATFAHIEEDLSGAKTGKNGRHPLPAPADLVAVLQEWGISNDTQVVAYDAQGGQFAGRLWWLMRWLGHARVAVLDGGWQAWLAATQWPSQEEADRQLGTFKAGTSLVPTVDAATVAARLLQPATPLLDARAPERFEGRVEPIDPVAGHVPGALNRFWQSNLVEPGGCFKDGATLRREFEALLAGRAPQALTHTCGSGVTAAHNVLAMEIAGLPGSALYPGSWSEWIADPAHPVATGP